MTTKRQSQNNRGCRDFYKDMNKKTILILILITEAMIATIVGAWLINTSKNIVNEALNIICTASNTFFVMAYPTLAVWWIKYRKDDRHAR